jgi:peptide/nickel transport system substrate-binding protein
MAHQDTRLRFLWEIDKKLQEDEVLPIVYPTRPTTCTRRQLKGRTVMVDSQYNGWRMEDVWLER